MKRYKNDQHFLIDERVLDRIIEYGNLVHSDVVLEIGAGFGNLTRLLAARAGKVIAVEMDPELADSIDRAQNLEVIVGDALKMEFPGFNKVVSNLPYSISSPVTFKLLRHKFDLGILMYQHEFAKRMAAAPGGRDYGRLSVTVQHYAEVEILEVIPKSAFHPQPEVRSALVKLVPRPAPYKVKDEAFFMKFITSAFSQRRKKLRNAILNNASSLGFTDMGRVLKKVHEDFLSKRAETLSPSDLANIANILVDEKT